MFLFCFERIFPFVVAQRICSKENNNTQHSILRENKIMFAASVKSSTLSTSLLLRRASVVSRLSPSSSAAPLFQVRSTASSSAAAGNDAAAAADSSSSNSNNAAKNKLKQPSASDPLGFMTPDQARLTFDLPSDRRKSPVAQQTLVTDEKFKNNARVARTINDDGTMTSMTSRRQVWPIVLSVVFVVVAYLAVTKTEEAAMARRHESIEKDIERERWRAKELGLVSDDDGFADKYMTGLGKNNDEIVPPKNYQRPSKS